MLFSCSFQGQAPSFLNAPDSFFFCPVSPPAPVPVPRLHGTVPPGGVCRLLARRSAELFGGRSDGPGVSRLLLYLWAAVEQQQGSSAQVQRWCICWVCSSKLLCVYVWLFLFGQLGQKPGSIKTHFMVLYQKVMASCFRNESDHYLLSYIPVATVSAVLEALSLLKWHIYGKAHHYSYSLLSMSSFNIKSSCSFLN